MGDKLTRVGVGEGVADISLDVKEWTGTGKILDSNVPLSETGMGGWGGSYRPRRFGLEIEFRVMAVGGLDIKRFGIDVNGRY